MKIGLLHCRSGVSGIWAPGKDAVAAVAAAEINANGGILNKEVELVIADCGFSRSEAIDATDMLVEVEGVEAIVGGHPSSIRDAISHRLAGRVPYVYTAQYEGVMCGPSTVAIGAQDRTLLLPALQWLRSERQAERFFFVGNDYIWPRLAFATTRKLVAEQGGRLVGEALLPMHVGEYGALLETIARSGAQVVVQALVGQVSVDFNRAFAAAGLDDRMLRFGLIADETVICGIGAEASHNLFTAAHYFADHRSRSNDRFLETYHDMFGEYAPPVSSVTLGCYQGVHIIAGLAREMGTGDSRALARHLIRLLERRSTHELLDGKPGDGMPQVYMARADGAVIEVIAQLTR